MTTSILYYFTTLSPWAYLGHERFTQIAQAFNCKVIYRPVDLLEVFAATGGLPLAKRSPARQRYRLIELQRWRESRNIPLNLQPEFWPFDPVLANTMIIAADMLSHDPGQLTYAYMKAVWSGQANLADPETLITLADQIGLPGDECMQKAKDSETIVQYDAYTREAINTDCFGSPTYILNGEIFFGQDRLEQLNEALKTGRQPFQVPQ